MYKSYVFNDSWDVDAKLSELGITKKELVTVAIKAVTAKNDAIIIDPINAPGQLSYIYGTRALREMLLPKGDWKLDRTDNIESTLNLEKNIKIIYQNVDVACAKCHPRAISGKGNASRRLVENNTGYLWPEMEEEFEAQENTSVWYFCVSTNGDEIRAEMSRPRSIDGNQFGDFLERIFIVTDNDWDIVTDNDWDIVNDDDADYDDQDYDIKVTKK